MVHEPHLKRMLGNLHCTANHCNVGAAVTLRLIKHLDDTRMNGKRALAEGTDVALLLEFAGILG